MSVEFEGSPRGEIERYRRGPGVTRSINMAHKIMSRYHERVALTELTDQTDKDHVRGMKVFNRIEAVSAGLVGFHTMLRTNLAKLTRESPIKEVFDIGDEGGNFEYADGLGDQDFTWHYAPLLAHAVVTSAEMDGKIPEGSLLNMSFEDWAEILRYGWFSDLIHDLALAQNGTFGGLGRNLANYTVGTNEITRNQYLLNTQVFSYDQKTEEVPELDTGEVFTVVSLAPSLRKALRTRMKDFKSAGCPVARKQVTIANPETDNHAKELLETGIMRKVAIGRRGIRLAQSDTPIDRMLHILASKIEAYAKEYGTPLIDGDGVRHERRAMLRPFVRMQEET